MKTVRVCGQCSEPTNGEEYSCPTDRCSLVLCVTCSNSKIHSSPDGSCPEWWGESLTEEEQAQRMQEVAEESLEC